MSYPTDIGSTSDQTLTSSVRIKTESIPKMHDYGEVVNETGVAQNAIVWTDWINDIAWINNFTLFLQSDAGVTGVEIYDQCRDSYEEEADEYSVSTVINNVDDPHYKVVMMPTIISGGTIAQTYSRRFGFKNLNAAECKIKVRMQAFGQ